MFAFSEQEERGPNDNRSPTDIQNRHLMVFEERSPSGARRPGELTAHYVTGSPDEERQTAPRRLDRYRMWRRPPGAALLDQLARRYCLPSADAPQLDTLVTKQ